MSKDLAPKPESENALPQEVEVLLKSLPENKRKEVLKLILTSQKSHSGPLPDSETLTAYNTIIPNGGDRLMKQVESQHEHRKHIENIGITRTFNQSSTGQWLAFAIAMTFGVLSWDLIKNGHEVSGAILGSADLVALVTVFLKSKSK